MKTGFCICLLAGLFFSIGASAENYARMTTQGSTSGGSTSYHRGVAGHHKDVVLAAETDALAVLNGDAVTDQFIEATKSMAWLLEGGFLQSTAELQLTGNDEEDASALLNCIETVRPE